ncbi:phage holin family protein [Actinomadura sediminis]|uniref:Phage holin family protein n=1 Tax=Actinomadura sediminis TaxID=1038904 RepID=A0ABW3ENU0_9ACTN
MSEATPGERVEDKSLGELVALASSNVSDLVRAEMELAKMELKSDARKGAISGVMLVIAAVMGGIIVILLSISLAFGLIELGIWPWLAFLIVAVLYGLLAVVLGLIAKRLIGKIEGAKRTRRTLKDTPGALRHRGGADTPALTD